MSSSPNVASSSAQQSRRISASAATRSNGVVSPSSSSPQTGKYKSSLSEENGRSKSAAVLANQNAGKLPPGAPSGSRVNLVTYRVSRL